jgi:CDP-diacylglycerol---serine O-phosphatidyltransferase
MFHIPNLFTASNLICGILAIILSLMGRIDFAPFFIFGGAIFDFFDGFLARKLNRMGELGKQLDSLADMVTFGVAPGILMLVVLIFAISPYTINENESFISHMDFLMSNWKNAIFYNIPNSFDNNLKFTPFIALFIPFMSMFRLAKFNIDTRQSESFIGLNTPTNTIFFTTFPLFLSLNLTDSLYFEKFSFLYQIEIIIPLIGIMSLLLISEIPMFSLKFKSFKWDENKLRYLFLITCLLLIVFLLVLSIPIIVILYVILSLIENKIKRKKHEIQS